MKTWGQCCNIVANKYELGTTLVTGHRDKYWTEAAELYCQSQKAEAWKEGFKAAEHAEKTIGYNSENRMVGISIHPVKNPYLELKSLPETTTK